MQHELDFALIAGLGPGKYRTPGTIGSLAINSLRLNGVWSIDEDIDGLAHDIRGMLRLLGWQEPAVTQPS
jgi:hypothetical protein